MNKVAVYLQGHLDGELMLRVDARDTVAFDGSVLVQRPELVVYPRITSDIRKITRFAWQLAEKGHTLPLTVRGHGTDPTGGAIGRGASIVMPVHMHDVCEYDTKQRLVRTQAGATVHAVQSALRLHGTTIPSLADDMYGTIGGAIASDTAEYLSGKYGGITENVHQLEVVLDNGDVIQTGPKNKRELSRLRGQQTREGEIYRGIDEIIENHKELLRQLKKEGITDRSGYPGIIDVQGKGGAIDLTPLFIGSQGTLGIISEMILRTEYVPAKLGLAIAAFATPEQARDAIDDILKLKPALLEYSDAAFMKVALAQGRQFKWIGEEATKPHTLLTIGFDDHSESARTKHLKKLIKLLGKKDCQVMTSLDSDHDTVRALQQVATYARDPSDTAAQSAYALVPAMYVPSGHLEDFLNDLAKLGKSLHADLPIHGSVLTGIYTLRPTLSLGNVGDRQKILKIIDQVNTLLQKHQGALVAAGGEGRILSRFARAAWTADYAQMMQQIKQVFDPHGILNPQVKANIELADLIAQLRNEHTIMHPGRQGVL